MRSENLIHTEKAPPALSLENLCIDTIRTLSMDAVQKANSGHPGTPMALAPVAYTLWQSFLRYDPDDPAWPNRDRFVLSSGHASMLLYSLLHLAGVEAISDSRVGSSRSRSTTSRISASSTAHAPAIPNTARPPASRPPPGRWARAAATASAWRLPARWLAHHSTARIPCSTTTSTRLQRRRHDGRRLQRGRFARRPPEARRICAGSTTTTTSRSRATPTWPSAKTSAAAFAAYGWNVHHVADANDTRRCRASAARASRRDQRSRRP